MKELTLTCEELPGILLRKFYGNLSNTILDKIEAFIFIIDTYQLKLEWTNKYACKRLGYSSEELNNLTADQLLSLLHPDFQETLLELVEHINENNNKDDQVIIKVRIKNGEWIWLLSSGTVLTSDPCGKFQYLLIFATEINITRLNGLLRRLLVVTTGHSGKETCTLLSIKAKKILKLIANGHTDKEISEILNISIFTAKTHRKNIIRKLGLKNSPTLIKYAFENGLD
jgi:PAS domain S-box-containing protein